MLSVVVPILNEAENIRPLVAEIYAALADLMEFEVLYVDDGSTDDSPAILAALSREKANFRVLTHRNSCGQSAALRSGIRAAHYPWIATLDGDGQNDPADLPALWKARPEHAGPEIAWMAIGHRVDRRDTWAKRKASRFANGLRRRVLRDNTPDTGCGIKIFSRQLFLELPWFSHIHRFLPALVRRSGGTSVSVPVAHRERTRGTSKYGVLDRAWVGLWDLMGVMWLMRRNANPIVTETSDDTPEKPEAS
jgi:glycosyltransferase involved in cell wall biosynthesis